MLRHEPTDAAATRGPINNVSGVGDVISPALMIRPDIVTAEDLARVFTNKHVIAGSEPESERFTTAQVAREGEGFTFAHDFM